MASEIWSIQLKIISHYCERGFVYYSDNSSGSSDSVIVSTTDTSSIRYTGKGLNMPLPRSCGGCQRDLVWNASHAPDCVHVQQDEAESNISLIYIKNPQRMRRDRKQVSGPGVIVIPIVPIQMLVPPENIILAYITRTKV